jgi:hypothetical protein
VRHAGRAGDVSDCRFRTVPDGSAGLRSVEDSVIELGSDLGRKAALRATDVGFDQMMLPMPFRTCFTSFGTRCDGGRFRIRGAIGHNVTWRYIHEVYEATR